MASVDDPSFPWELSPGRWELRKKGKKQKLFLVLSPARQNVRSAQNVRPIKM